MSNDSKQTEQQTKKQVAKINAAFLGTGVMGKPMAGHLAKAGCDMKVFNRTKSKAENCAEEYKEYGVKCCDTIAETVKDADIIFTMVGFPQDVEEIYTKEDGIFNNAKKGAIMIDLTTSSPELAQKLTKAAEEKGFEMLDAPVSGGDSGAKAGTLVVMCGGKKEVFDKALPYLETFGKEVTLLGGPGMGQHCKACNQIVVAGNTAAYTEALHYARKVGLDPELMFKVIAGGAAGSWQITNMAPRAMNKDHDPGFFIKHFIKDMKIAKKAAESCNVELPVLNQVLKLYEEMSTAGHADLGTQALIKLYEEK